MTDNAQAPATKEDIQLLMEQIGTYYQNTDNRISTLEENMDEKMEKWKVEIIHEFHVTAEDIRHDILGTTNDRLSLHDDRIKRLERHAGLAA